ncbi:unnamed protein product [Vitrella brassicaformis CCMP3155]|uniref:Uncharacterized protein n=1 Tax=Vitrella brassicaformis (strain CCMP3155) TaxID=1169540 RepID=A0A0G4EYS1_VITBC|nr:unnamed protein product [Vitrella brassicaformis CCMP3155]|eukprot:CEM03605.1 unnamed protein product [Vitrella brassicaformis CCMP3155]
MIEWTKVVLKAIVGYIEADRCRDLFESCVRGDASNMVALELLLVLLQEEALRQMLTQGLISPTERTRLEQYTREYIQRSGGDDESLILAYRARPALTPEAQLRIAAEFLECRPGSVVGWQEMSRCLWQSYTYMQLEVGEETTMAGASRPSHKDRHTPGDQTVPSCILGSLDVCVYPFLMFLAPFFVRGPPLLLFASYLSHKHPSCGPLVQGVMGPLKALPFPVMTAADTDQGDAAAASQGGHRSWALFATLYVHLRESESHTGVWEGMPDNDDDGVGATAASVFNQDECTRLFAAVDEALLVGQ